MIKSTLLSLSLATALITSGSALADEYMIDKKGAHASIQFKISHLGYSWLWGRFNDFDGSFSYDEKNKASSKVSVVVKTKSVDSNHAERDKHLRSADFLDVKKFPVAKFVSSGYQVAGNGKGTLKGKLTLHGVTRNVVLKTREVGAGKDPWGGFRRGFEGQTRIALKDYGINKELGPASATLDLIISIEGIKQ
ncbi:MAG TPA: YceI family protein [Leucothrix mucor]|uniref:YceI family protein n=1 Tax=Leucothrix mucor TaxID=45248 RepID=A0A7V2T4X7_LEUMU|nr:YceI family protein [Leucothrix mucor]